MHSTHYIVLHCIAFCITLQNVTHLILQVSFTLSTGDQWGIHAYFIVSTNCLHLKVRALGRYTIQVRLWNWVLKKYCMCIHFYVLID